MTSLSEPLLRDVLRDLSILAARGSLEVPVAGICADSRAVKRGDSFVCLPGYRTEGGEVRADRLDFAPQAIERGARSLVVERELACPVPDDVTVVRVADCWAAIASMASVFYGSPSRQLLVVGVTGTSGKTSTTYFIDSVLSAAGRRSARLGTIEYKLGDIARPAAQTTPEAPELQRLLAEVLQLGMTAVVMEVSSHALELRRVQGVSFDVAVFTNLSQDHLNFHPDMRSYLSAKGRLFEELASGGKDAVAVVNENDPASEYVKKVNRGRLLTYGIGCRADVVAVNIDTGHHGSRFTARTPAGSIDVRLAHRGDYSVHNALAAVATGAALGLPLEHIRDGIEATPQVPGRFELIDCGQDFLAVVDYAHKPGALERVLQSARALRPRRLIAVFGCGGDRDHSKRALMGEIAARLADRVVVTSDNPRSENPIAIIEDIARGIRGAAAQELTVEPDRRKAIAAALAAAGTGDLVLIAGKGHETYQIIGRERIHFDDREVVREILSGR